MTKAIKDQAVRKNRVYALPLLALLPPLLGLIVNLLLPKPLPIEIINFPLYIMLYGGWFALSYYSLISIGSILVFGDPETSEKECLGRLQSSGWKKEHNLILTYVTRGENILALTDAVTRSLRVLEEFGVNYEIEIATERRIEVACLELPQIHQYVVPSGYETSLGSLYKARALHYAVEARSRRKGSLSSSWILHMDEESVLTPEALAGIRDFVDRPEGSSRIGQGEIQYNSLDFAKNKLVATVDSSRTGHDLGYFRFQFNVVKGPLFGAHGSFLLVPAQIERELGFDVGVGPSLTEDAYFGLDAFQRGIRFDWISGFLREQSPSSLRDLFLQRRRWINGNMLVAMDSRIKFIYRLIFVLNHFCSRATLLLWAIYSGLLVYLMLSGVGPLPVLRYLIFCWSMHSVIYVVGAYRNTRTLGLPRRRKIVWILTVLFSTPFSVFIETCALAFAIFFPTKVYHVVSKTGNVPEFPGLVRE